METVLLLAAAALSTLLLGGAAPSNAQPVRVRRRDASGVRSVR